VVVVIAALFTAWLAVTRPDALIAEDYYRRGLNPKPEELATQAKTTGLTAELVAEPTSARLRLLAYGNASGAGAVELVLHPRSGQGGDRVLNFDARSDGHYEAAMPSLPAGLWDVSVRMGERRLAGVWKVPGPASIALTASDVEKN
jgi:hypothetical protein